MRWPDSLIASCHSWDDFWDRTRALPRETEKGAAFERLTQLYLQTEPEYKTQLQHVWLLREVPADIRRHLNLPSSDEGIDLLARTRRGEYWAIQTKFRSQRDTALSRRDLSTFSSLAFHTCDNITLALVAHTSTKPISKHHLMPNTGEIGLDRWQSLDHEKWKLLTENSRGSKRPAGTETSKATSARSNRGSQSSLHRPQIGQGSSDHALRHGQKPCRVLDRRSNGRKEHSSSCSEPCAHSTGPG